jgi:MFS family permease
LRYLRRTPDALAVVSVAIGTGVVGWVYLALMPLVVTDRLGGDAFTFGVLSTAVGLGSVPPSIALAIRSRPLAHEGALFYLATFVWAAGVVGYGLTSSTAVAVVALTVAGAGSGLQQVLMRTLLIRLTEPAFHGRVLGTLMLTWGANVVGTLGGGLLAEVLGVGPVIVLSGLLIALVATGVLVARPQTWRL